MSRVGKQTIEIPSGVTVELKNNMVVVKGPKGQLERVINSFVEIKIVDNQVTVDVKNKEDKKERSLWGTYAAHIKNMVMGVTEGFKKQLEINGVGYKVVMQGNDLKIDIGFSHPVLFKIPNELKASVEKNVITIEGPDKEMVGQISAEIRAIRKPEPYKGKGIKYMDEQIRRKAGKTAKSDK
ncbi:MAG: 50S ribosomal protein L6 [Candidatus Magasanikbacteria bacterium CG_4_10_14_0_2_um_filter_37_12]|uniref:Large ribosomal subunit protein uL6 n=1 Tax=Candidatus Magasanikbacteria bacterium CG_4_10_14_0_2_um_filter_37_12 TaxID=1974637 RepID=A0A2M7V8K5_9BACT|nr:MAG: 50S ribosomal protein L6 [Candidatus Magasanikbacteria bacterium CG_4_10_14_0_2_um_filter_37_12]